jgi:hypothetical protein
MEKEMAEGLGLYSKVKGTALEDLSLFWLPLVSWHIKIL